MAREIVYGDPERDELFSSPSELERLKNEPGWKDVLSHFEEVAEGHRLRLESRDCTQRDADFSRGAIAICDDLQNILGMLIDLAERQDG